MPIFDNIGGVWSKAKPQSNIGGVWTKDKKVFDNVGGVWAQSYTVGIPISFDSMSAGEGRTVVQNLSNSDNLIVSMSNVAPPENAMFGFKFTCPAYVAQYQQIMRIVGSFASTISDSHDSLDYVEFVIIGYDFMDYWPNVSTPAGVQNGTIDQSMAVTNNVQAGRTLELLVNPHVIGIYYPITFTFSMPWSALTWLPTGDKFSYQ